MERKRCSQIMTVFILFGIIGTFYFDNLVIAWDDYVVKKNLINFRSDIKDGVKNSRDVKTVLFWNGMFDNKWHYLGDSNHFSDCPKYNNCVATVSRNDSTEVSDFDALLFHGISVKRNDVPVKRNWKQIYVFVDLESPLSYPISDSYFDGFYNATMTYRLDSDCPRPYRTMRDIGSKKTVAPFEKVEWLEPNYDYEINYSLDLRRKFKRKKKIASWLVSHCETHGNREDYVNEMKKYTIVDVIGKCDNERIGKKIICPDTEKCFSQVIQPNYFFYLAFENTLCKDYVTEKFFNALRYDVIPVVYGGANYSLFAPPHSYIDALDFESPKALANYLIELSKDRDEYLKYFWWKRFYTVDGGRSHVLCRLCEFLNEQPTKPTKSYSPLNDWFAKDKCPMQDIIKNERFATKMTRDRAIGKSFISGNNG